MTGVATERTVGQSIGAIATTPHATILSRGVATRGCDRKDRRLVDRSDNDNKTANNKLTTIQALSGGIIAGGCSVIVSNPFDVVKTKCQSLVNSLPTKNVIHGVLLDF